MLTLERDIDIRYDDIRDVGQDGGVYQPQWNQHVDESERPGNPVVISVVEPTTTHLDISRIAQPADAPTATVGLEAPATHHDNSNEKENAGHADVQKKKWNAVVTSVWGYDYASMALMLGWSITQHNDLPNLNADMILLTLPWDNNGIGLTAENKTRLEKVGWKIRELEQIHIDGIDFTKIQPHRRNNLNKLQPFGWSEYDKIVFMDADTVVKGPFGELFAMPGDFAAAPDVWFDIQIDSRFNSGVMVFHPSKELFADMIDKIKDPLYHDPTQGDQDFLQRYWQYRDFKLPFKYNLNIIMYEHFNKQFNELWDEAVIIHFTIRKPVPDSTYWCRKPETDNAELKCKEWGILDVSDKDPMKCPSALDTKRWQWYQRYFAVMLDDTGLFNEVALIG